MTDATVLTAAGTTAAAPIGKFNAYWAPSYLPVPGVVAAWFCGVGQANDTATPPNVLSLADVIGGAKLLGVASHLPTAEGTLNGHTPVRFTSGRYMTSPALGMPGHPFLAFAIKINTLPTGTETLIAGDTAGPSSFVAFMAGSALRIYFGHEVLNTASGVLSTGLNIIVAYHDLDADALKLRVNGADVAITISAGAENPSWFQGHVGIYPDGTDGLTDTALAALLLGGGSFSLGTKEVKKLEGLLAQLYSGTAFLPGGHPYQSVAPQRRN